MDALIQDETTRLVKHFKLLGCTSCTSCIWWKRLMAVVTHCDVCLQTILSRDFWTWMATYGNHPRAIILGWLPHFCICLHAGCSNDAEESLLVLARGWALDSDSPVALHVCFFGVQIVTEDKVCWTLGIVTFGTRRSELYSLCSSWSFRIVNTALMPAFVSCTIPVRVWVTKHFLGLLPAAFAFSFLHAGHRQEAFAFLLLIHCFPSHYDFVGEILLKTVKTVVFVFFFRSASWVSSGSRLFGHGSTASWRLEQPHMAPFLRWPLWAQWLTSFYLCNGATGPQRGSGGISMRCSWMLMPNARHICLSAVGTSPDACQSICIGFR